VLVMLLSMLTEKLALDTRELTATVVLALAWA
jgi:hypothetical protein